MLIEAEAQRQQERELVIAEYPNLDAREKGESLRRLFKKVTLFWDKVWHPAQAKPFVPRKTDRAGRWGYKLLRDKIEWEFTTTDLDGSW